MALRDMRVELLKYIESKRAYTLHNFKVKDVFEGNLLPYLDAEMSASLSPQYYSTIKSRILPINVLQKYIGKVANAYKEAPSRTSSSSNKTVSDFVEFYADAFKMDASGRIADEYSNLCKAYAWKPYVDRRGRPQIKELSLDQFTVYSNSSRSPDEPTVFIEFMGKVGDRQAFMAWTDEEYDAFFDDASTADFLMGESGGVNLYGVIPYKYGKRDKNRLLPIQDSDMLAITKAIPLMLTDAAGAQFYAAFSILYGIDIDSQNLIMAPNAFWNFKSDPQSDKAPVVGTIKPEADTGKVMDFVSAVFIMWLDSKGVRVGSMGQVQSGQLASGLSKIVDELDVSNIIKKSQEFYENDEIDFWNNIMPKIHNQWVSSGELSPATVKNLPGLIPPTIDMDVVVEFPESEVIQPKIEQINEAKEEMAIGTMTLPQAIMKLHPEYSEEQVNEVIVFARQKALENVI